MFGTRHAYRAVADSGGAVCVRDPKNQVAALTEIERGRAPNEEAS